jgi:membrane protein DedA with SNARE-associated domain
MPLVKLEDVDKAEDWFNRHGDWAVLIGRVIPIVRSLISIPAGVERMPLTRFLLVTTLGSGIWNTLLVGAGYLLGDQWHIVEESVGVFQKIVIVVVVLLIVWWLVKTLRNPDRPRHARQR